MAWTQAQADALEQAIADSRGARVITFGDQSVTFDIEQARSLLAEMRKDLAAAAGAQTRTRFAATSKGV